MWFRKKLPVNQPVRKINVARSKWRFVMWGILVAVVGVIVWVVVASGLALRNVSSANTSDAPAFFRDNGNISPSDVKVEGDSRINILLLGMADQGGTDTVQVLSIDPINKTSAMLSIPRDLYVKEPSGGYTRINAVYPSNVKYCAKTSPTCNPNVNYGADAVKKVLSDDLGIKIHYYAMVDFSGFKKIVDTIGGVDITVSRSLSDPSYPCDYDASKSCGYYQAAGTFHMSGTQLLKYVRCRKGTCGTDFGRSSRQQQSMIAIAKKMVSANILLNPVKLTTVITTVGSHMKTDMQVKDIINLYNVIGGNINPNTTVLSDSATDPLKSANIGGADVIVPRLGLNDFSDVKLFVLDTFLDPYVLKEKAALAVINATGKSSQTAVLQTLLKNLGYNIVSVTDSTVTQAGSTLTNNSNDPYTSSLLKHRFNASPVNDANSSGADLTLTVGSNYLLLK